MAEHTKGEMKVVENDPKWVEDEKKRDVFLCMSRQPDGLRPYNISSEEAEANAERLVLCWNRHDDLLAALKEIREWRMHSGISAYENCEPREHYFHAFYLMEREIAKARQLAKAAIAKAKESK